MDGPECLRIRDRCCRSISQILSPPRMAWRMLTIYLCSLPIEKGRATLDSRPIWPCSPQGLPHSDVTTEARELSPHIFTLTPHIHDARGGYFLRHLLFLSCFQLRTRICIRYGARCCLDFPPSRKFGTAVSRSAMQNYSSSPRTTTVVPIFV